MSLSKPSFRPLPHRAGFEFDVVNPLIDVWKQSWDGENPLLDIGCGNCTNALQGIEVGARVVATELNGDTLAILRDKHKEISALDFSYLELPAPIPFTDNSISGVLASEVFHFLDHDEIIASIQEVWRVLTPDGVFALTCCCEDVEVFKPLGFKELRVRQRAENPECLSAHEGILDLYQKAFDLEPENKVAQELLETYRQILPKTYFNFFHPEQLAQTLTRNGFQVELAETGAADYYPIWRHGPDDQVRIVARKTLSQ